MTFLNSIINQSKKHEFPFDHWEYDNVLSNDAIEEIIKADIPDVSKHNLNYDAHAIWLGWSSRYLRSII